LAAFTPVVRVPVTMTSSTVVPLLSAAKAAGAASAVASASVLTEKCRSHTLTP